jgi:hypothetical protein
VSRLLVLFHDPYHLHARDAQAWLKRELSDVLCRDQLQGARLTRLGTASSQTRGGYDWLLELAVDPEAPANPRGALGELVADLRLLGMAPMVAMADDRNAIDLGTTS